MKGTIRARGRDTWQLVYDLPAGPDGKRKQRTETVRGPKKAAQIRLREILSGVDQGRVADAGKLTLGKYLEEWLPSLPVVDVSLERYESLVRNHIKPELGHLRLGAVTGHQLETFYLGLAGKLGASSIRATHSILSKAFSRALRLGLINVNPCSLVELPVKSGKREVRFLSPEEKVRFLSACKCSPYYAMILVAIGTGVRLSELRALAWDALDLEKGMLHVRRIADRHNVILDRTKTKKSRRTITLSSVLVDVLRQHHKHQMEEKMRLRPIWQNLGLVFPRGDGGVLGISTIQQPLATICRKADVDISFHGLRHTHASDLIAAGVHVKVISERLGHASISMTMDKYGHLFPNAQDEAAKAIDAALRAAM